MEVFQLDRFIKAQDSYNSYETALQEVKNGEKRSHWIWYIFPQIDGMGHSSTSKFYGIKSLQEAKAYFKNETLRNRLYEITNALLAQDGSARSIFGGLDAMKVRSCMTLFNLVSPNDVFAKVLYKFYDGEPCKRTLSILKDELEYREKEHKSDRVYNNEIRPLYTPNKIGSLKHDEVFVFGSNLAGAHGGGAARAAMMRFGAEWGKGVGLQGQSYAIPTMQGGVETIKPYVDDFIKFAKKHTDLFFYVTRIGCGIAGFKDEQIAPLFVDALDIENICLPQSFVKILKPEVPQELMAMMHGQIRTLIDVLKALNEEDPIKDCNDAQKRLTEIVERNVRYGDEFAFMAIRTLWCLTYKYEGEGSGVDIERLEREMNSFHDFSHYAQEPITKIMYGYSVRKMVKYIQFLNEFRRYKDFESIKEDLHSIPFSHCSSNDEHYYFSFYPGIIWRVYDILLHEQEFLFNSGTLDNELLEEAAFKRFDRVVAKYGLEETINLAYGDLGCHPDLKGPMPSCGGSVWGPYYRIRDGIIEKGCSDFRRWPFSNTSFEMRFASQILDRDPNYLHKQGDWHGDLFIPIEDYTLPVYYSRSGKVTFKNDSEKREFIELHKQDPNAGRVQE